jgi:uncharacterized integral membrane protein
MKATIVSLMAVIVAGWVIAIAILSMQNAELVSLTVGTAQTLPLPFGFLLAVAAGLGMVGAAIVQPLLGTAKHKN